MCGIVGYIGKSNNIKVGLSALKRLEYRGYDSAGLAVYNTQESKVFAVKSKGKIKNLEEKVRGSNLPLEGNPCLCHTRWATHGVPSERNAHPHCGCERNIWLVHNGIVENYKELKQKLIQEGHKFNSETDSEVIAHLIEKFFEGNLEKAVQKAVRLIKGTYGLAVIARDDPYKLVAARFSSPLLIGIEKGEYFVASDPSAIITATRKVVYLEDGEIAVLNKEGFSITNVNGQEVETKKVQRIEWSPQEIQKGGYSHFMLKEIMEQAESFKNSLRGRLILNEGRAKLGGLESVKERLQHINNLKIVACGTAFYAATIGSYMLEEYTGISTQAVYAHEFRYKRSVLGENSAVLAVSQSGETADTLGAIREAKQKGKTVLSVVNVVGSSLAREVEAGVYNYAGPEIGVASTKAFTSQLGIFALLTLFLGRQREMSLVVGQRIVKELTEMPDKIQMVLNKHREIKQLAEKYKGFNNFLYLGRKYNYPVALEGALKLKEISYIHAEGCTTAEMKHGPLAMLDERFPVVTICPSDSVYQKSLSNIEEIKAREVPIIALATEGNQDIKELVDDVIYIPKTLEMLTPILSVIPLQLFAYYMGVARGCDIDQPRHLAKSVTTE